MLGVWWRTLVVLAFLTFAALDRSIAVWFGMLAAALALSYFVAGGALQALSASIAAPTRGAFAGEVAELRVRLTNGSALFPVPWVRCALALPPRLHASSPEWLAALGPGDGLETTFRLRLAARGVYRVGRLRVQLGDWLHLFPRTGVVDVSLWLTVYPEPVAPPLPPPARLPHGGTIRAGSPFRAMEPAGLREYRAGDSARAIAWKASAHRGQWVVREFPPVRDRSLVLLIDLRPSAWPGDAEPWVERALSLAAAFVTRSALRDESLGLRAWGRPTRFGPPEVGPDPNEPLAGGGETVEAPAAYELPPRHGPLQRRRVLDALALLHPAGGPPFAPGALTFLRRHAPRSSVVWFAGIPAPEVLGAAATAAASGHAVALAVAAPHDLPRAPAGVSLLPVTLEASA